MSHGSRGCVNCQRCDVKCTWCCYGAVGAKDEFDDDKTVYLHVFTTIATERIRALGLYTGFANHVNVSLVGKVGRVQSWS